MSTEKDPNGLSPKDAGAKLDSGKLAIEEAVAGVVEYFPRALVAVEEVSAFGAKKYTRSGWKTVSDGQRRYSEAGFRHRMQRLQGEVSDADSTLLHLAHEAWNALAVLELYLGGQEPKPTVIIKTGQPNTWTLFPSGPAKPRPTAAQGDPDKQHLVLRGEPDFTVAHVTDTALGYYRLHPGDGIRRALTQRWHGSFDWPRTKGAFFVMQSTAATPIAHVLYEMESIKKHPACKWHNGCSDEWDPIKVYGPFAQTYTYPEDR